MLRLVSRKATTSYYGSSLLARWSDVSPRQTFPIIFHGTSSLPTLPLTIAIIVVLARAMYLDFDGHFCPAEARNNGTGAAPGECYYYRNFLRYKVGILLHLAGVLPASVLAVVQFTPFIRQRWIVVHRICGYLAIILYMISLVGVLMIARHALGGSLDVQAWCGFVGFGVLACFALSVYNIKQLQIEQHRAWMLRGWFYVGRNLWIPLVTIELTYILNRLAPLSPRDSS
jgi:hypothetical protein